MCDMRVLYFSIIASIVPGAMGEASEVVPEYINKADEFCFNNVNMGLPTVFMDTMGLDYTALLNWCSTHLEIIRRFPENNAFPVGTNKEKMADVYQCGCKFIQSRLK